MPIIFIIVLFFSSCSLFNKLDELNQKLPISNLKFADIPTTCPLNQDFSPEVSTIGSSDLALNTFQKLLTAHDPQKKFNLIERSILWSLLQMNYRPDLVGPSSRLQVLINFQNEQKYWEFGIGSKSQEQKKDLFPYLYGLKTILKYYKSSYSLNDLARFLNQKLPKKLAIEKGFSRFIEQNSQRLLNNPYFAKTFFKAGEPLKENETIRRIDFLKVVSFLNSAKGHITSNHLFPYLPSKQNVQCNFDLGLYENSIYLISKRQTLNTHAFGHQESKKQSFLAVSSHNPDLTKSFKGTFLFQTKSYPPPSALCSIKTKKSQLSVLSTTGRDPGQHLFHLIQYGLQKTSSIQDLIQYINFPRHMFLANPDRMLYESARANKDQLESLLNLGFPIYHIDSMGQIWTHAFFPKSSQYGFVIDPRGDAKIQCVN